VRFTTSWGSRTPLDVVPGRDRLDGSTAGVDRARYLAEAEQDTALGAAVGQVADEIAQDRATLLDIMRRLDIPVRRYKVVAGSLAEKAGRLKSSGRLLRSPSPRRWSWNCCVRG
jgi:hypothetical protein